MIDTMKAHPAIVDRETWQTAKTCHQAGHRMKPSPKFAGMMNTKNKGDEI
jgi:hypothetical protein